MERRNVALGTFLLGVIEAFFKFFYFVVIVAVGTYIANHKMFIESMSKWAGPGHSTSGFAARE